MAANPQMTGPSAPATSGGGPGGSPPPQQSPSEKKDGWDKAEIIGTIVGAILIPVVLAIGSCRVSASVQRAETAAQMVVLGAEILRTEPDKSPEPLRNWALDLIDRYADPKLPPEAREALLKQGFGEPSRVSGAVQFDVSKGSPTSIPLFGQTFEILITEVHPQPDGSRLVSFSITSEQQSSEFKSVGPGYTLTFGKAKLELLEIGEKGAKFLASSTS